MPVLRVLDRITRRYQRLGYLKRIIKRVNATPTSNLDNIGSDLVEAISKKIHIQLTDELVSYIRIRLQDRAYKNIKEKATQWLKDKSTPLEVQMELQDLYLSNSSLPSQVGKLVKDDWDDYPNLAVNLGFVRSGTYSINTRGLSFLHFVPNAELQAFQEYTPESNPFLISRSQGLLILYSLLENDGEVVVPLFNKLLNSDLLVFNDRQAGDFLPEIYRIIITRHRMRSLTIEARERLETIEKSAESITKSQLKNAKEYSGGSAREEASRPRLEPYADIGFFDKPQKMKYEYSFSEFGKRWIKAFRGDENSAAIEEFLARRFFHTAAQAWGIQARELTSPDEIVPYLQRAAKVINSSSGYAPIEELALVGGIWALADDQAILEPGVARDAVIAYQKANPYKVRFTVDRSGVLAHARFMDDQSAS